MNEKKVEHIKENISEALELPKDIMLDLPRITLLGERQLFIENHKGIIQYSKELIRVKTKNNSLKIFGNDLLIKTILTEEIIITGKIYSIEFDNRGV